MAYPDQAKAIEIGERVERFVRDVVATYGKTTAPARCAKARAAGVLTPHILADGSHLTQRETAHRPDQVRPLAARPAGLQHRAPDEGNMYLLGKVGSDASRRSAS
jgi:acyl-CoA dehydrogenase